MLAEILGTFFSGLGLFFIGIKILIDQMRQMAGRRFRQIISRAIKSQKLAALWGLFLGAILQSTSGLTFIVVSLVSSGSIAVDKAMPLIAWSNVGNSLLVVLAVLDIRLLVYYLLGTIGIAFYFDLDRSPKFRHITGALLGVGLLFFGLNFLKAGAAPLNQFEGFRDFIQFAQTSNALLFIIGSFIAFIAHSSTTISVVAVTMTVAGVLGTQQTILLIYGANVGSGLSTFFLSMNLRGTARQAALFQTLFKCVGAILLVPLLYVELNTEVPLVHSFVQSISSDAGRQMSCVYLIFQLVAALITTLFAGPISSLLQRFSPPTETEVLSRPKYIYDQALLEPETAVLLVEKELGGVLKHFPEYLASIRIDTRDQPSLSCDTLHEASQAILVETDSFITDLMDQGVSRISLERIIIAKNLTELIKNLEESLFQWVGIVPEQKDIAQLSIVTHAMAEGLHVALAQMSETFEIPDAMNLHMLQTITSDRRGTMKTIREEIVQEEINMDNKDRQMLFEITGIFERMFWLMHRISTVLGDLHAGTVKDSN